MECLKPHALLVPGPGLGHINGSMLLAKALVSQGFSITFVYFARSFTTHSTSNRLPPPHPCIRFEVLPDGHSSDGHSSDTRLLMHESLEQLIRSLSIGHPICCIISDTFMSWTQDVADKLQIARVDYWTTTATSYLFLLSLQQVFSKGYIGPQAATLEGKRDDPVFLDCILGIPQFPIDEIPPELHARPDAVGDAIKPFLDLESRSRKANRVLFHSLYELESIAFEGLAKAQIPGYAIGPLIQYDTFDTTHGKDQRPPAEQECISWLDTQAKCSVIYVSFGSNAPLSPEEIMELAMGLEASGHPFLWVIRVDTAKSEELSGVLPEGFELRTKGKGMIVSWAPQVAVLEHEAVGGFLTHCGWNSTLESVWMGVPMLACPRKAEQKTNARFIAKEWGVGILLGGTKKGVLRSLEVQQGVVALMIGNDGQQARKKVLELREIVRKVAQEGSSSHTNLVKFVDDMRSIQSNLSHTPCLS